MDDPVADFAGDAVPESSLRMRDSADEVVLRRPVVIGVDSISLPLPFSPASLEDAEDRRDIFITDGALAGDPKGVCIGDGS